jgi:hypothetical protein
MPDSIRTAVTRALEAYEALQLLGEDVEDEWTYVQDLAGTWHERLEAVVAERGDEPLPDAVATAVDRAIDEIGRIEDPHRAIDWLSTFPQLVLVAAGERP